MDQLLAVLFTKLGDQALPTIMLVVALVYVHKSNKTLINALNEERRQRIDHLEKSNLDCIKDRADIHNKQNELWDKFIEHLSKSR